MSEKKQAWYDSIECVDRINVSIENAEKHLASLRDGLVVAQAERDKAASDHADERVAEGANVVEDTSGKLFTIRKAKKRKGGAEPTNAYYLDEVRK